MAYARKDTAFLDELRFHLKPLERSGRVKVWYDGKIEPGKVWEAAIKEHLHSADIILMLVSANAIASDYFYDKEMSDALARHEKGEARVVPFILKACDWMATPLGQLQAIPKNGKPVTAWPDPDDAYADAAIALRGMVKKLEEERKAAHEQKLREEKQKKTAVEAARKEKAKAAALAAQKKLKEEAPKKAARKNVTPKPPPSSKKKVQSPPPKKDRWVKVMEEQQEAKGNEEKKQNRIRMAWLTVFALVVVLIIWKVWIGGDTGDANPTSGPATISPQSLPADVTIGQPTKSFQPIPLPRDRKSGFEFVKVEGGTFMMGSPESEQGRQEDECQHEVTVGDFYIGKYEVTQADWKIVMGENPSYFKNCDNCPVESVSWNQVQVFIEKASKKYGVNLRLPSEEEWEYAARGGHKENISKFKAGIAITGWYKGNSDNKTHPVGGKSANELGVFDMLGNVWEWCEDKYAPYPNCSESLNDNRILRGGSYFYYADSCRPSHRFHSAPGYRSFTMGFRLCLSSQ